MLTLREIFDDFALYAELEPGAVFIDTKNSTGESPIHWMAALGDVQAIELLAKPAPIFLPRTHLETQRSMSPFLSVTPRPRRCSLPAEPSSACVMLIAKHLQILHARVASKSSLDFFQMANMLRHIPSLQLIRYSCLASFYPHLSSELRLCPKNLAKI